MPNNIPDDDIEWDEADIEWEKPAEKKEEMPSWGDWARQKTAAGLLGAREMLPFAKDIAAATKATVGVPGVSAGTGDFRKAKEQVERQQEAAGEESPLAYGAGEVGSFFMPMGIVGGPSLGGVATGVERYLAGKAAPRVGTAAADILGSAGAGAAVGAVTGAGEGLTPGERLKGAAESAALGTLGGAAVPAVTKAAGYGLKKGAELVEESLPGLITGGSEKSAAKRYSKALEEDVAKGAPQLTPEEIEAARKRGQEILPVDIGGESVKGEARRAVNLSPEAETTVTPVLRERAQEQQQRYGDYFKNLIGHDMDAAGVIEKMRESARDVNKPAYKKAYEAGASGVWNPELYSLTNSPIVKKAIPEAVEKLQSTAILEGKGPVANPFTKDESGNYFLREGYKPTLEFWDGIKRSLDDKVSALERKGKYDKSRVIKDLRTKLLMNLDRAVPEFKEARAGAAKAFGEDNAFDAGLQFLSKQKALSSAEAKSAFTKLKEPEKELFVNGVLQDLSQRVKNRGESRDVTKLFDNAELREKLGLVLGPERTAELEAFNRIEELMQRSYNAIQSNSTTAKQLSRMGVLGQGVGKGIKHVLAPALGFSAMGTPGAVAGAAAQAALEHVSSVMGKNQANALARKLISKDPKDLQQVASTIAQNSKAMEKLRNVTKSLSILESAKAGKDKGSLAAEDREGRASGGKVGNRDYPAKRLTRLERAAKKAQDAIALETRPIMDKPDALVAKALEIARNK